MNIEDFSYSLYQGMDLRDLTYWMPNAKCWDDIVAELKKAFAGDDAETITRQKSKSSFTVEFSKGLCLHAEFLISTSKKTIKRIC
jgi:hypothetical protein